MISCFCEIWYIAQVHLQYFVVSSSIICCIIYSRPVLSAVLYTVVQYYLLYYIQSSSFICCILYSHPVLSAILYTVIKLQPIIITIPAVSTVIVQSVF
jgi:hypothetical protein